MNFKTTPPKLALRIFRWYCRSDRREELEGDLEEFFFLRLDNGSHLWKAKFFFWWNVIRCYRTYSKKQTQNNSTMYPLIKSYFKLALRHSWKNKWSVLINVVGLGMALSMCVFMYTVYAYNWEFDSYYGNTENIYRLHSMTFDNGSERRNEISPIAIDDKLRNEFSGIRKVASYVDYSMSVKKGTDFFTDQVAFVSDEFFQMFNMPLWYGSFKDFEDKPLAFLTKQTATKYFGNEVALDKQLSIYIGDNKLEVIVAGVFERIPENNSFDAGIYVSYDHYVNARDINKHDWKNRRYVCHYFEASENNLESIESNLQQFVPFQNDGHPEMKVRRFEVVPFRSSVIQADKMNRRYTNTRLRPAVKLIFVTLISMIFLIACFNLANTSMAMISKRLKEIGIRKTLGSESKQIFIQFLFEMGIICSMAFIIAVSTANMTSRAILGLFGGDFILQDTDLTGVLLFVAGFLLVTTLVAGFLPALYALKFQPVAILRRSVKLKGVSWLNKTLTIAQFAFSIAVLTVGITFSQNKEYLDQLSLGYQKDGIFVLNLRGNEHYSALKQRIDQMPNVVTAGTRNHISQHSSNSTITIDTISQEVRTNSVGKGYLDLMGIEVVTGRGFLESSEADMDNSILVNQEFAKRFYKGENPVDQVIKLGDERKTIVGITANIIDDVYEDARQEPTIFTMAKEQHMLNLVVKANQSDLESVNSELKEIWAELIDLPYTGQLQEDLALGSAVNDSDNLQKIFLVMAMLGGFLSLVGIFSLAKLNVARRLKEISIRKVLGARFDQLMLGTNRSFLLVVLLSLFLGTALGYFTTTTVLDMIYKYHVDVSLATTLLCGLLIMLFSISMISMAVFVPTKANPVVGLRDE